MHYVGNYRISSNPFNTLGLLGLLVAATVFTSGLAKGQDADRIGGSYNGVMVNGNGTPVYGFANIKAGTWLGVKVLHANFVILDGKQRPIGNAAVIGTSTPGTFVWISDIGPSGIVQASPSGVIWRDAAGGSGKYVPL
jgi:hypothetical protein